MIAALLLITVSAAERPNVVLVMADDVGRECFGCYGSTQYRTPSIDRLAAAGVQFMNCHSQPLCTPSRVKLMTGRGNAENYVAFSILKPGLKTIGQYFQEAGYATAVCGKWQLLGSAGYAERFRFRGSWPEECGFDRHCLWQVAQRGDRYWHPMLRTDGKLTQHGDDAYGPDVVARFAREFIRENREQPFLLYYPMMLVHDPFLPTPESPADRNRKRAGKNRQANFEDMATHMDAIVGSLVDELVAQGVADDTLFLFCGDNGTHKTIVSTLDGREIRGGKGTTLNRGTHVPLVASWPGRAQAHAEERLVDFTDFLPTVLEAAGIAHDGLPGVSFLSQIEGREGPTREVSTCYYWPRPERGEPVRYAFDGRFKLYADGRLFDTREDPEERTPLPANSERHAALRAAIDRLPQQGASILNLDEPRPEPPAFDGSRTQNDVRRLSGKSSTIVAP